MARVICGKVGKVQGPVKDIVVDPEYLDVTLPGDGAFSHPVKRGRNAFAYVFDGAVDFAGAPARSGTLAVFGDGDSVEIRAGGEGARFLFVAGRPLGEPVAWYGPIVMNTQEELRTAFEEYRDGTFIKHPTS